MSTIGFSETELALTSTALAGDAGGLYHIVSGLMDDGIPFDSVLFDYLIPTEQALGERWQQGDYLVSEEHAATAAIETVISLMVGMLDQPEDGHLVVVAAAEGDDHSLAARAVSAHLLFLGQRVTYLGANVPGQDLGEFLAIEPPTALVVSCAMTAHLLGALAVIEGAHGMGVPVVAGGSGFGPDGRWARALGADIWVGSLRDVADAVDGVAGLTVDQSRFDLGSDLRDLIAVRAAVVAEAEDELAGDTAIDNRLAEEIMLLERTVESSLLVDDDQVVHDMLHWQHSTLISHGYDGLGVARALLAALEAAGSAGGEVLASAIERLQEP